MVKLTLPLMVILENLRLDWDPDETNFTDLEYHCFDDDDLTTNEATHVATNEQHMKQQMKQQMKQLIKQQIKQQVKQHMKQQMTPLTDDDPLSLITPLASL